MSTPKQDTFTRGDRRQARDVGCAQGNHRDQPAAQPTDTISQPRNRNGPARVRFEEFEELASSKDNKKMSPATSAHKPQASNASSSHKRTPAVAPEDENSPSHQDAMQEDNDADDQPT